MSYANRGMLLEQIIEISNNQYRAKNIALIQKIPTPVKVLKNRGNKIEGFWEKKSTVDFVGIYGKKPVCFDCKQTKGKSLPFANIEQHQLEFMTDWDRVGGIAFIIVYWAKLDVYYRLSIESINYYIKNPYTTNKKSIPLSYFKNEGAKLEKGNGVLLDYLKGI